MGEQLEKLGTGGSWTRRSGDRKLFVGWRVCSGGGEEGHGGGGGLRGGCEVWEGFSVGGLVDEVGRTCSDDDERLIVSATASSLSFISTSPEPSDEVLTTGDDGLPAAEDEQVRSGAGGGGISSVSNSFDFDFASRCSPFFDIA